ncbi:hypothetical protein [Legionella hackeliae]|uniref:Uncharacterized protein n=1 Tax=Legionella hackeliae TaxID=449 RepID=A0A0A8URE9_LEGHA|nr:hypothetical protein [Legionella hackeliae]KTD15310.1 hypothetical protein Lhac_0152 [Legionella hackeliae]CEK11323.1 protein of unknown function [Legionella hackeliae]STX48093.1 Uncharacterised protein [Legionella hackeliae]
MSHKNENSRPGHHDQQGRRPNDASNRHHSSDSSAHRSDRDERNPRNKTDKHFSESKPIGSHRTSENPRDHRK